MTEIRARQALVLLHRSVCGLSFLRHAHGGCKHRTHAVEASGAVFLRGIGIDSNARASVLKTALRLQQGSSWPPAVRLPTRHPTLTGGPVWAAAALPACAQCDPPPVATPHWRRGGPSAPWAAPCLRRPHRAATRKAPRAHPARAPTLTVLRGRCQARRSAASARSPPPGEGSGTVASSAAGVEGWVPRQRLR
eukprot:scaffold51584_cov69-Phaeocystis_antarctica.AAC.3